MKKFKLASVMIVAFSTIILAALRTAMMFFAAGERSSRLFLPEGHPWLSAISVLDAVVALLAVEFGIVALSAIRVIENKGHVPKWIYTAHMTILVLVSIFAGIGQSLGLIDNLNPRVFELFTYAMVLILGFGASFAAWASGEVLGSQLYQYTRGRKNKNLKNRKSRRRKEKRPRAMNIPTAQKETPKKEVKAPRAKPKNFKSDLGI